MRLEGRAAWSLAGAGLVCLLGGLAGMERDRACGPGAPAPGGAEPHAILVDGNLSDLAALAQGAEADPCNELMVHCGSGFDLTAVLVAYLESEDRLYVGLDVMDGLPVCEGAPGPGVPGDADGDGDPSFESSDPDCFVFRDEFGVGRDEFYLIRIDTDLNGSFDDPADLRVIYRDNRLDFFDGTGDPIPHATGEIALGVAGAPFDPRIPNENLETEDIEIAVDRFSSLDPKPRSFAVDVLCGSVPDGVPNDSLDSLILVVLGD